MDDIKQICIDLEHFETPLWAAKAILEKETTTFLIVDPCCGAGILSEVAKKKTPNVLSFDIHNWGYPNTIIMDWFTHRDGTFDNATCFMNPPFSTAVQFVEKSIQRNFKKIICFQRFAWYESQGRRDFWNKFPPSRVYICGDRAHCWRHDIPQEGRGSSTPTAHAWFVWDQEAPKDITVLDRIYKS